MGHERLWTIFEDCSEFDFGPARGGGAAGRRRAAKVRPGPEPAAPRLVAPPSPQHERLAWVEENVQRLDAEGALVALLRDPPAGALSSVVAAAHRWLAFHGDRPRAGFVLTALLEQPDAAVAKGAVEPSIHWLAAEVRRSAGGLLSAVPGRLLARLLTRNLPADLRQMVRDFAIARLRARLASLDASHLFVLLTTEPLEHGEATELAELACAWLERFGGESRAPWVYRNILGKPGLAVPWWRRLAGHAIGWMVAHAPGSAHVVQLKLLARRSLFLEPAQRDQLAWMWLGWVKAPEWRELATASGAAIRDIAERSSWSAEVARELAALEAMGALVARRRLPLTVNGLAAWAEARSRAFASVDRDDVREAIVRTRHLIYRRDAWRASLVMPALLPLAARCDRVLLDELAELAGVLAEHRDLPDWAAERYIGECRARVRLWPDRDEAESLVEALADFLPRRAECAAG